MSNVIIIGNGPAAISAALYTAQNGIETILIGQDYGELANTDKTVFGFDKPVAGKILIENSLARLKNLGTKVINTEVIGFSYSGKLHVKTKEHEYTTDSLIIATGRPEPLPDIDNLTAFEGKGVHYCAACDAFFYRDKNVAVLGNGEYALYEATQLLSMVSSVTLLTDGQPLKASFPNHINVIESKIEGFFGQDTIAGVLFEDDSDLLFAGLFVAVGIANGSDLARKLGVMSENQLVKVNEKMATNLPGVFAAGGCTDAEITLAKAIYEGEKAGIEAVSYLKAKDL